MAFIDDFNGEAVQINLPDRTPSGGTAWTFQEGGVDRAQVNPGGYVEAKANFTGSFTCDNQGTASNYVVCQLAAFSTNFRNSYVTSHMIGRSDFLGMKIYGTASSGLRVTEVIGNAETDLITGQGAANLWVKMEVDESPPRVRLYEAGTGASPGAWVQIGSEATYTLLATNTDQGVRTGDDANGAWITYFEAGPLGGGDVTPPILSLPTGTQTGSTTASGTVTTDEGNGTLSWLFSVNATEPDGNIEGANTQPVTATGVQNVTVAGLTPSTVYYPHYIHRDASGNLSDSVTGASFTTDAAGGIITPYYYHKLMAGR